MNKQKIEFTQEELFKMEKIYSVLASKKLHWFGAIVTAGITIFMFIVAKEHSSSMAYIIAFCFLGGYLYFNFTGNKKYNIWDSHLIDKSIYNKIQAAKGDD